LIGKDLHRYGITKQENAINYGVTTF